jgi:uncharacterized NAD(P)/FAD-binding protein YdhS
MTAAARRDRRRGIDMNCHPMRQDVNRVIAVIGGGFAGSLFALKLSVIQPGWTILLVEANARLGRGLAYGACGPQHILNVPVSRMEVGLEPSFADWLIQRPGRLREALEESGWLTDAFVPRHLFGDYLEQHMFAALARKGNGGIRRVHGEAMAISQMPRQIMLDDGRALAVDAVVLATGNQPPALPFRAKPSDRIVVDPWAPGALDDIGSQTPLLLVGSGLTMIDVLIALEAKGHAGPVHVVSRHGLLPQAHRPGGSWRPVLSAGVSPRQALRIIRANVREAQSQGIPWQRVFDAVRPAVAAIWHAWSLGQRAQFLRHLRAVWDVHRHRMAERVAVAVERFVAEKRLTVSAGRILAAGEEKTVITAVLRPRAGKTQLLEVGAIINCTGPQIDLRRTAHSLLATLQRQGLVLSDPLGLGLESDDCALKAANGMVSDWLYALGPLTRPAWWEIVAVPEINAQIERLVHKIAKREEAFAQLLPELFLDIGAGI